MKKTLIGLLVGMHFRPPAKIILQSLPSGSPVKLKPEPENPYDENAVAVYVRSSDIPEAQHSGLAGVLPGSGFTLDEVLEQPEWHLGYLAAAGGKPLLKNPEYSGAIVFLPFVKAANADEGEAKGLLAFDGAGQPVVRFDPGEAVPMPALPKGVEDIGGVLDKDE